MSHKINSEILDSAWEDFDTFLAQKDYKNCAVICQNVGDLGYEMDALRMHKTINSAIAADALETRDAEEIEEEYQTGTYKRGFDQEVYG